MVDLDRVFSGALRQQSPFLYGRFCILRSFHSFCQVKVLLLEQFLLYGLGRALLDKWSLVIFSSKVPKSQDFTSSRRLIRYASNDSSAFCALDLNLWRSTTTFRFGATYPFKAVLASSMLLCSPGSVLKMHCTGGEGNASSWLSELPSPFSVGQTLSRRSRAHYSSVSTRFTDQSHQC